MTDFGMFSDAERSALRLDGQLFTLNGVDVASDEPDVLETRVRIARQHAPERYILDGRSAAWVWRAWPTPPIVPEFCQSMSARGTDRYNRVRAQRYVRLNTHELVRTASGTVLTPWRTCLHVLRWVPDVDRSTVECLLRLAGKSTRDAQATIRTEFARNQHGFYLAPLQALFANQPSVTR